LTVSLENSRPTIVITQSATNLM